MNEQNYTPTEPYRKSRDFSFLKLALSWVTAIVIALALQHFAFQSYQVFGQSMEPTLHEGDYLIISKLDATFSYLRSNSYIPERGEIVVIEADGTRLIKRVIGLPGETVRVRSGELTVFNQENLNGFNPYEILGLPMIYTEGNNITEVPRNHVYVVGDNRQAGSSLDSRNQLGTVPTENIVGKLVLRLWPPAHTDAF